MCKWKTFTPDQKLTVIGVVFLVIGPFFFLTSYLFPLTVEDLVQNGLDEKLVMRDKKSEYYVKVWQNNTAANPDTVPMYKTFYVFNIMNPEEVQAGKDLKVQEVGPFVYRYNKVRFQDEISGEKVEFKTWEYYTFEPKLSVSDDRTTYVTLPNLGIVAFGSKLPSSIIPKILESLAIAGLGVQPFYNRTVYDFIWGWESPILKIFHTFVPAIPSLVPGPVVNQTSREASSKLFPKTSIINNGVNDESKIFQFEQWNGVTEVNGVWASPENVAGTEGITFHRGLSKTDVLQAWIPEVRRVFTLDYVEERKFKDILLYRFTPSASLYYNIHQRPENAKYYQFGPSGVFNVSSIFEGVPLFLSNPHFFSADPVYLERIQGLNPNYEQHATKIDVEPLSGITMYARKRTQVNVRLLKVSVLPTFNNLPDVLCPYLWMEESGEVTDTLAKEFKETVYPALLGKTITKWLCIGAFAVCILICLVLFALAYRKREAAFKNYNGYDYVDINSSTPNNNKENLIVA